MTAYDIEARADAEEMLALIADDGFGQVIVLSRTTTGAYDTSTGKPGVTSTTQTGSGVVLEYSTFTRAGVQNTPGSLIQAGDRQLLLSPVDANGQPLNPPPAVDDLVTLADGTTYTVTSAAPLSPAGTPIYFDCNLRGV